MIKRLTFAAIVFVAAIENPAHAADDEKMLRVSGLVIAGALCHLPIPVEEVEKAAIELAIQDGITPHQALTNASLHAVMLTTLHWGPAELAEYCQLIADSRGY